MIIQDIGFAGTIVDFISLIFDILAPIMIPIGRFMVLWIEILLPFFPYGTYSVPDLLFYFIIFFICVIAGISINSAYPGDKPIDEFEEDIGEDLQRLTKALELSEFKEKKIDKKSKKSKKSVKQEDKKKLENDIELPKENSNKNLDIKKCKECNMPLGDSPICPYCGTEN